MSNSTSYRRSDGKSMLGFLKGVNPAVYLFGATVLALILANSPWSSYYFSLLETPINLQIGDWQVFSHHGRTMNPVSYTHLRAHETEAVSYTHLTLPTKRIV